MKVSFSLTSTLDQVEAAYQSGFWTFVKAASAFEVPMALYLIVIRQATLNAMTADILTAFAEVATCLEWGVMILIADDVLAGRKPSAKAAYHRILPRLPRLFVALLALTVIVGIGLAVFVVPAIWAVGVFSLMLPIIVLERDDVMASLVESRSLTRRRLLPVLGTLATAALFALVVPGLLELPFVVGNITTGIPDASPLFILYAAAVNTLFLPVAPLTLTTLYRTLEAGEAFGARPEASSVVPTPQSPSLER